MAAFDAVAEALGSFVVDAFGTAVEIRLPVLGAIGGISGARSTTYLTASVVANVERDIVGQTMGEGTTVVECDATLRADAAAFALTNQCEVRIMSRDTTSQWRQVVSVELEVGGVMVKLRTRRMQ